MQRPSQDMGHETAGGHDRNGVAVGTGGPSDGACPRDSDDTWEMSWRQGFKGGGFAQRQFVT